MKKSPSYQLDFQSIGYERAELLYLFSRERLPSLQEEIYIWWSGWRDFLKTKYRFDGIWLELKAEDGETFRIGEPPMVARPAGDSLQRFPLTVREEILGWLYVEGAVSDPSFEGELPGLLPLMSYGLSQELRRLHVQNHYQVLSDQQNNVFESLARTLGLRDHETESHTMRVSQWTMLLVDYLRFPVEQWDAIRHGALLHDIGKLGIPDAILLKPGSLSAMERRMMEVHVTYGYNILSSITKARQTLDIVLYHHERWDGSGYPDHLQGEQIPLVARLFAVVDVYDALTSDRPYRTAWLPDRALAYLKEKAGIQFDPEMVKAFMEVARLHLDQ
jgi:putative nucleotidyltransferase with HDIG domain